MAPPLTCILCTYKRPQLLKRAVVSVLKQSFPDFLLKIYDNASNDGTREVVEEFMRQDSRIRYHCHPENIGMFENSRFALEQLETPFFTILADDDWIFPDFFQSAMSGLKLYPEAILASGATYFVGSDYRLIFSPTHRWKSKGLIKPPEGLLRMLYWEFPTLQGTILRSDVLQSNLLKFDVGAIGDYNFMLSLAASYPVFFTGVPSCVNFIHTGSTSFLPPASYYWPGFRKICENLEHIPGLDRRVLKIAQRALIRMCHTHFGVSIVKALMRGRFADAGGFLRILLQEVQTPFQHFLADFIGIKLRQTLRHRLPRLTFLPRKIGVSFEDYARTLEGAT